MGPQRWPLLAFISGAVPALATFTGFRWDASFRGCSRSNSTNICFLEVNSTSEQLNKLEDYAELKKFEKQGWVGKVWSGVVARTGSGCILKAYHNKWHAKEVRRETVAHGILHRNNRLGDVGHPFVEGEYTYIPYPLYPGDTLQSLIHLRLKEASLVEILKIFHAIVKEVKEGVHDLGILHNDLHDGNILLNKDKQRRTWSAKIIDFGSSSVLGEEVDEEELGIDVEEGVATNENEKEETPQAQFEEEDISITQKEGGEKNYGHPFWMSPEAIRGKELQKGSDIFFIGSILFFIFVQEIPRNLIKAICRFCCSCNVPWALEDVVYPWGTSLSSAHLTALDYQLWHRPLKDAEDEEHEDGGYPTSEGERTETEGDEPKEDRIGGKPGGGVDSESDAEISVRLDISGDGLELVPLVAAEEERGEKGVVIDNMKYIINKTLAFEVDERYQDCGQLLKDISTTLKGVRIKGLPSLTPIEGMQFFMYFYEEENAMTSAIDEREKEEEREEEEEEEAERGRKKYLMVEKEGSWVGITEDPDQASAFKLFIRERGLGNYRRRFYYVMESHSEKYLNTSWGGWSCCSGWLRGDPERVSLQKVRGGWWILDVSEQKLLGVKTVGDRSWLSVEADEPIILHLHKIT